MEENNELYEILEAVVLRDSLSLYMTKLSEHRAHPDFKATMRFVSSIYKKYYQIADKRVMTDDLGRIVLRKDIRRNIDLN